MKKHVIAAAVVGTLLSGAVFAQELDAGSLLVRARAVKLNSDNGDSTGLGLSINDKWIPEVDFTYFFDKNLAAELILTVPQKHTVSSTVLGGPIGTLKHLPPTLTVQYHFTGASFKPYIGAGVNYTRFSAVHLADGAATVDKNSFGLAFQVGADVPLTKDLYLNVDLKKVQIKTDVTVGGVNKGEFKVDPVLVGVGLGWKF